MLNSVNNYPVGSMQVPNTNIQPPQSAVAPQNPASTDVPANNISNNIAAMPDKRDIVGLGKALYGQNASSYNFIKNVSSDCKTCQSSCGKIQQIYKSIFGRTRYFVQRSPAFACGFYS